MVHGDSDEREPGFRVEDRRRFDPSTGEARHPEQQLPGGGVLRESEPAESKPELPVSFATLIQPFYLMGLAGLGLLPHPDEQQPKIDLAVARHAIGLLELLQRMTAAVRSQEESQMLDEVLYSLRMQFLDRAPQQKTD